MSSGVGLLREAPRPGRAAALRWAALTPVAIVFMVLIGQAG
ncbi:hypothetical protein [Streptomyces sp. NPDC004728]